MTDGTFYRQVEQKVHDRAVACGRNPMDITIIAVSKGYPIDAILDAYQKGARIFGESRVQEAFQKIPLLPSDCSWHMIGTLQSNKISKAISCFQLIHSVDHIQLAQSISQVSQAKEIVTSILLQVNTSGEKTKHGMSAEEWHRSLDVLNHQPNIRVEGLMTMAPFTDDEKQIRTCFQKLFQLREAWRNQMKNPASFHHLSMGMSNDYLLAIEEGATMLRIGTAIFGNRS